MSSGAPFDDKPTLAAVRYHDGDAPAFEIEGYFIELAPRADVDFGMLGYGSMERTFEPGLEIAVEIGKAQHVFAVFAVDIDMAFETNARFGEGDSLVGAQHVHAAEVMNGRQPFHHDVFPRYAQGPARKRDRYHHRQQIRRQPDRQGDRKQECFERGPRQQNIEQQFYQHQQYSEAHDQHAELARAAFEGGGRRLRRYRSRNGAPRGGGAGAHHHHRRRSALHRGTHEDDFVD